MNRIEKCFFDTNVFIYALDMGMDEAQRVLEEAIMSDSAVTSAITIMEYCTGIYRKATEKEVKAFRNFIEENYIHVSSADKETALLAAKLRGDNTSLKLLDALQLATAVKEGCEVFYTNDKRLRNLQGINLEIRAI